MQAVKDSFYMALRERLAGAAAARTTVIVGENTGTQSQDERDVFYLRWGRAQELPKDAQDAGWRALQCSIEYRTAGTEAAAGRDRGRCLAAMDEHLSALLAMGSAAICDYTVDPANESGNRLLWTRVAFGEVEDAGTEVKRTAEVTVLWREESQ